MLLPIFDIDFCDKDLNFKRNYKEEIEKVINDFKRDLENLGDISKTQKTFLYAELLASDAIKKANNILRDMKKELLENNVILD
jgi:ribosomal protein S21